MSLYYVMMLAWVGCMADTAEVAAWFGDDIAFRADSYRVDFAGLPMMGLALSHAGAGTPFLHRLQLAATLVLTGGRAVEQGLMSHCLATTKMAGRLGLPAEVCEPLGQVFTRWDAKGVPDGVGGEQIAHPVRLFHLADTIEVFHRAGGVDAAVEVARARRGKHFDPAVVDLFCATAPEVLADMDAVAEMHGADRGRAGPAPAADRAGTGLGPGGGGRLHRLAVPVPGRALPGRGPAWPPRRPGCAGCRTGRSCRAARRPGARRRPARGARLDPGQARAADRHRDRAAAPAFLLDRTGPGPPGGAGPDRRDRLAGQRAAGRVRLPPRPGRGGHPGHRPDPGRRRCLPGHERAPAAPARPHARAGARPNCARKSARGAWPPTPSMPCSPPPGSTGPSGGAGPAGLTPRELEVLTLIARGGSTRQVARALGITAKTAETHIERIYAKIGASTRSTATLFAMQHGLLDTLQPGRFVGETPDDTRLPRSLAWYSPG